MTRFSHWLLGALFVGVTALVSVDSGTAQESSTQVAPGAEAPSPSGTSTQQGTGVFSGGDTTINAPVDIRTGLNEEEIGRLLEEKFAPLVDQMAREKGVPAAPLNAILVKLGEASVPLDEIPARLDVAAQELVALRQEIAKLPALVASFRAQAEAEFKAGKIEQAQALAAIAQSQVNAVTLVQDQYPEQALEVLNDAENRLNDVLSETSAMDQLLHGYIYKTKAQAYAILGDDAQADEYLDKAIKLFEQFRDNPELKETTTLPDFAGAINGIGNIHYARKQYKEAIADYEFATSLAPDYAYAWHDMFLAYVALAQDGDVNLPAMRNALRRTKETAHGYPTLDPNYITKLEAMLANFEQLSRP